MKDLEGIAQFRTSQMAMCKGPTEKYEWHDLVAEDVRSWIPKQVANCQS